MLQIITGKFFVSEELYVTRHRTVLYTNLDTAGLNVSAFETAVGNLVPSTHGQDPYPWIYEVEEKLEAVRPDGSKEFMISTCGNEIVEDFSSVAAFVLNITCTPDVDLYRRVVLGQRAALGIRNMPSEYIGRVFDRKISRAKDDAERLSGFVDELVGLHRPYYLAAMRAIRRYVNGLHRLADDLDLAYTLLVASVESLAQDFDGFDPKWEDYPQNKRARLDKVLMTTAPEIADEVRQTLIKGEHLALSRRYREFIENHLSPSFFREEAEGQSSAIGQRDLRGALDKAYRYRSGYVHSLRELPRYMKTTPSHQDACWIDGEPALSFHGMARVARHVIMEFVTRSPKCDSEDINYRRELPNIVTVPLAFSIWGGFTDGFNHKSARRYLSGFLEELSVLLFNRMESKRTITDIRNHIEKVVSFIPGLAKAEQKLAPLTLYLLFHQFTASEYHQPDWEVFVEKHKHVFDEPIMESLLVHVLLDQKPDWDLDTLEKIREDYYTNRFARNALNLGKRLEVAVTLFSAEVHRREGKEEAAKRLVSEAVENLPGESKLTAFEKVTQSGPVPAINWMELLITGYECQPESLPKDAGDETVPQIPTEGFQTSEIIDPVRQMEVDILPFLPDETEQD